MSQPFAETSQQRWSLTRKKAVITGATKGIGLAIAQEFLSVGAEVMIKDFRYLRSIILHLFG